MLFQAKKNNCDSEPNSYTCTKQQKAGYYYDKSAGKCQKFKDRECRNNKYYPTETECKEECVNQGKLKL